MRKKQYASMQEELAARKAAAGLTEEPRATIHTADTGGSDVISNFRRASFGSGAEGNRRRRGMRIWLTVALVLFVIGMAISIVIPDYPESTEPEYPFDEMTTDEEIIEYIDERWSIDDRDSREKIRLLSWQYNNQDVLFPGDIGAWTLDVSENFVILRTEYPVHEDEEEFFGNSRYAVAVLQKSLQEEGLDSVPVAMIARQPDSGELVLVLINQGEYYKEI